MTILHRTLAATAVLLLLIATPAAARGGDDPNATTWSIDKAHTQVQFKVRHLGISNVTGNFGVFDAALVFDPSDIRSLEVNAAADVSSIDTGIEKRDAHLRSEDFFHADEYPQMTFESTGISEVKKGAFRLHGNLTIRGITRPVVFDAELLGVALAFGTERAGFTAATTIKRKDFGLEWSKLTEAGGLVVADDVTIMLEVQAIRDTPQAGS